MKRNAISASAVHPRKLFIQYSILQGVYWSAACAVITFAAVLLSEKGFSSSQTGIALAAGNLIGVLLQPFISGLADRGGRFTLHRLIIIFSLFGAAVYLLTALPSRLGCIVFAAFIITDASVQVMAPLTNSISVYYANRGIDLDFGKARSVGSLTYAICSSLLGIAVESFGVKAIILTAICVLICIAVAVMFLPLIREKTSQDAVTAPDAFRPAVSVSSPSAATGFVDFIRKYPSFCIVIFGLVLILAFHSMHSCYMIYIVKNCGGGTAEMGTALSISACCELPVLVLFSLLVKKASSEKLLGVSAIFFFCKAAALMLSSSISAIYCAAAIQMFSYGLYAPASVYYTNKVMKPEDAFRGQGYITAAGTLGAVIGSLLGGMLIARGGAPLMNLTGVIFTVIGTVFVLFGLKKKET